MNNSVLNKKTKLNYKIIQETASEDYHAFFNGRKWGFVNSNGIIKIRPQYDEVCAFHNDLACVKRQDKWGFINKKNETIIPFMYDILKPVHRFKKFYDYDRSLFLDFEGELCAPVCYKGRWGFIDILNRTVIPFRYEDVCINKNAETSKLFCVKANNLWGFIDKKRNTVIKFIFDNVRISAYNPKVYTVIQKEKFGICKTYQNYGLVDSVKGLIVPCKFRCENFKKGIYEK